MTYQQHPVCRRGGCPRPASDIPAGDEADLGLCDEHRQAVRAYRDRLTTGVGPSRVHPDRITTRKGAPK